MKNLENINIECFEPIPSPKEIKTEFPLTGTASATVKQGRKDVENILLRKDPRLMMVVGPCSVHDEVAALDYAKRLKELMPKIEKNFYVLMRVYFEKPRTNIGWKGFINDPDLNGSFHMGDGLKRARQLMIKINELGIPIATEALDPFVPQYLDDLITWSAIGARTVESQTHREMASGLSTAVGFKNSTDGSITVAINALKTIANPHHFLGINNEGQACICTTKGNPLGHIVLRGGNRPNYDSVSVDLCEQELAENGLPLNIMIDCSHGNSSKKASLQGKVLNHCLTQILEGNTSFIGFMLESNIFEGNQKMALLKDLKYGVSITDACIGWEETAQVLLNANERLGNVLQTRK